MASSCEHNNELPGSINVEFHIYTYMLLTGKRAHLVLPSALQISQEFLRVYIAAKNICHVFRIPLSSTFLSITS